MEDDQELLELRKTKTRLSNEVKLKKEKNKIRQEIKELQTELNPIKRFLKELKNTINGGTKK